MQTFWIQIRIHRKRYSDMNIKMLTGTLMDMTALNIDDWNLNYQTKLY